MIKTLNYTKTLITTFYFHNKNYWFFFWLDKWHMLTPKIHKHIQGNTFSWISITILKAILTVAIFMYMSMCGHIFIFLGWYITHADFYVFFHYSYYFFVAVIFFVLLLLFLCDLYVLIFQYLISFQLLIFGNYNRSPNLSIQKQLYRKCYYIFSLN